MSTTRVPLTINVELYPGRPDELAGEPHIIVVEYGGVTKRVGFHTIQELSACLLTEARLGRMPTAAVEAALMHAGEWFGALDAGRGAEPQECGARQGVAEDGAARIVQWSRAACVYVGLVGYVAAVWLGAKVLVEWVW